ncbi:glycosyl transferase family 2 [Collibacillus ludicampi]|jgi:cellulose synthase/poly-beta-1,6-N-acetylglucosamine synthase-like glycosyltransferase|uniref:Glycosyl transferase family 2 n=1 Tax=Collibacillus ludicampi TaxID=2771369 RepID=A0AAV4LAL2_9BACL|nr:glycosyltransferase family 2 protein [Collibacillus ludicampi]GIM44813.1 glycosyl transferase family 2 [Collibacillus ludicampi]
MSILHSLANDAFIALQGLTGAISAYQVALSLAGLKKKSEEIKNPPEKTFAVLVAAHNEEEVIAPLIENLQNLDYPRDMYDIFVICDNCTDHTADIVRKHGAIALERHDKEKRGKGYAIEWALERLWEMEKEYDAVVMFDADNLVAKNFLREMNEKLCQGARVIQGYLDTKNPFDSWISISYAVAYWFTNRMWQLARYNLNLPNALGGTGICIETALLKEIGWGATSLTEDLEFTVRCVDRGINPVWAHNAKVYDEKPLTLKASMRQRIRWMQGHFDCARKYMFPLLRKAIVTRNLSMFDSALYLFQPMRLLIVLFTSIMLYLQVGYPEFFQLTNLSAILPNWFWIVVNVLLYLQMPLAMLLERVPWKAYLGLIIFPLFVFTWFPVTVAGYFTRNNREWSHTVHTRAVRLEEISH